MADLPGGAYIDQLVRDNGLSRDRTVAIARELDRVEMLGGSDQRSALTQLAAQLDGDARGASDGAKVRLLAASVRSLAGGR